MTSFQANCITSGGSQQMVILKRGVPVLHRFENHWHSQQHGSLGGSSRYFSEGAVLGPLDQFFCLSPRNKDFQEVTLEKDGRVLLHFALAYGFRNIQNFVQKLKRGKLPYHYVEAMACPSGQNTYTFDMLFWAGGWVGETEDAPWKGASLSAALSFEPKFRPLPLGQPTCRGEASFGAFHWGWW